MKTNLMTVLLGGVASFALVVSFLGIQSSTVTALEPVNFDESRTLSVTGVSSAKVSPDRVAFSFAVENEERTAQQATQANAEITNLVIEALRDAGVSDSEISTSYYNVYPIYEYVETPVGCIQYGEEGQVQNYCPPSSMKQILAGYKAVNNIQVESEQLDRIGQWIDAAVQAGANRVDYVFFSISSQRQDEVRNDLIESAVQDARNKAEIAIRPLGMEITDVLSINLDSYPSIIYPKRGYEFAAGAPPPTTPIIPGTQEVLASIHATFGIDGFVADQKLTNTTIHSSINEEFQVTLESNPSTGYRWQITSIDETIARLIDDEYIPPETGLVGASGKQVLTFEALDVGKTQILIEYVRPWEPESPEGIYSVEVIISPTS